MPTLKQKAVAKDLLENVGKPIGQAMLDAGYSLATSKNPDHITDSKGFQSLLEQYLPDVKLLEKHDAALSATKWNDFTGERETDHATVLKAVDMGYKLKNRYVTNQINILNQNGDMGVVIKQYDPSNPT